MSEETSQGTPSDEGATAKATADASGGVFAAKAKKKKLPLLIFKLIVSTVLITWMIKTAQFG